jgi:HPt (histidine-containing phosphotransfer) domain-containing protein
VRAKQDTDILNVDQLRSATMDDADLMREVLATLLEDTSQQVTALSSAVASADAAECRRLAHYCKGACASAGAASSAAILRSIERSATQGDFAACGEWVRSLAAELKKVQLEAALI